MKKLALKKETLRHLQDAELRQVVGGTGVRTNVAPVGPYQANQENAEYQILTDTGYTCPIPSTTTTGGGMQPIPHGEPLPLPY